MKQFKIQSIVFIFLLSFTGVFAQSGIKLGHINSQNVLSMMPETDSARRAIEKETKAIQDQLEEMQVEFNKKYQDYINRADSLSQFIRQSKEEELQSMQERIQMFEANAQQNLQQKRSELFDPIVNKLQKAIDQVGEENGYTYIFDVSAGGLLYHSEDAKDITALVKKKLNIKEETTE
jgi:outer membrane protein